MDSSVYFNKDVWESGVMQLELENGLKAAKKLLGGGALPEGVEITHEFQVYKDHPNVVFIEYYANRL